MNKFQELKKEIEEMQLPSLEPSEKVERRYPHKVGESANAKIYLKSKTDSGFHIYSVCEHHPNIPLTGKDGVVTEIYYDLREGKYFAKRNGKDVAFSERNVDFVFISAGYSVPSRAVYRYEAEKAVDERRQKRLFDFLSTENNAGMFQQAYNLLSAMGDEYSERFGRFLVRLIKNFNKFEVIYKTKLVGRDFRADFVHQKEGTKPHEILGTSKLFLKILRTHGFTFNYDFDAVKNLKPEVLNKIAHISKLSLELDEEFGLNISAEIIKNELKNYASHWQLTALNMSNRYEFLDYKRLVRYAYYEALATQGLSSSNCFKILKDYLNMCQHMGFRRIDRYPKHLKTMHDVVSYNYQFKIDEIHRTKLKELQEHFAKYAMSYKDYILDYPKEPEDIILEGNALGHCVASYVKNVVAEKTTILFLRKKDTPDESLVTVEVKAGAIVQARGAYNRKTKEEEQVALSYFAKKLDLQTVYR